MIPVWGKTNATAWQLAMTYMMVSQYIIYMFIGVLFHYLGQPRLNAHYKRELSTFRALCAESSSDRYSGSSGCRA